MEILRVVVVKVRASFHTLPYAYMCMYVCVVIIIIVVLFWNEWLCVMYWCCDHYLGGFVLAWILCVIIGVVLF